jgi:hypothetical protein
VVAANNYGTLAGLAPADRPAADASQRALNLAADLTIGVAIAAATTGLVLLIAHAASSPEAPPASPETTQ